MPIYHLNYLNRDDYIASIAMIRDPKTVKFADMSLKWWDGHFSWQAHGCVVLCNDDNAHLCYIFYTIDRYRMYLTIHNIFTPLALRRHGYAYELLKMVFDLAITKHVSRFKLVSISKSLDFYLALGFVYWGVNSVGDYYCDLPIPTAGLDGLHAMIQHSDMTTLIGKKLEAICTKIQDHDRGLSPEQSKLFDSDKIKMGKHFMLDALLIFKAL